MTDRWRWRRVGLVMLSGLLMALALPPWSLWPLAWVALVPLWRVILSTTAGPWWLAAGYGLLWGLVYYGISLAWITHLHPLMWMGVPWASSVAIALSAWIFITLWGSVCIALWGVGVRWVARHQPHRPLLRILVGTALWCLVETLRNYTPLDWSPLSLTQSPNNLWVLHLAQLSGPAAITAVLVATNGLWAEAWGYRPKRLQPESSATDNSRQSSRLLALGGLVLITLSHGLGGVLYQWPDVDGPSQALTLGLVQGNIPTREKLTPQGINQALQGYIEGYLALVAQGVDAVITPEGALPVIWQPAAPQPAALIQTVRQAGVPLWIGTFAPQPAAAPGMGRQYTQSLLEIRADGLAYARYDKVQLVPLGEYIPFEAVLGGFIGRLSPLGSYLVPGLPQQTFPSSLGTGIIGICYESAYSRLFRHQAQAGGTFIVTTSNNDPYPVWMMLQHHGFDVIRAVETNRWALRVTNTGLSGLVDSQGHTRWLSQPNTYSLQIGTLYHHNSLTPYVTWGDWLTPLLLLSSLAGIALSGILTK